MTGSLSLPCGRTFFFFRMNIPFSCFTPTVFLPSSPPRSFLFWDPPPLQLNEFFLPPQGRRQNGFLFGYFFCHSRRGSPRQAFFSSVGGRIFSLATIPFFRKTGNSFFFPSFSTDFAATFWSFLDAQSSSPGDIEPLSGFPLGEAALPYSPFGDVPPNFLSCLRSPRRASTSQVPPRRVAILLFLPRELPSNVFFAVKSSLLERHRSFFFFSPLLQKGRF